MGNMKEAAKIYQLGEDWEGKYGTEMEVARTMQKIFPKWQCYKLNWNHNLLMPNTEKYSNVGNISSEGAAVIVIVDKNDGFSSHTIALFNGLIYDGNNKFPVPLSQKNLDHSCDGEFSGISRGYYWVMPTGRATKATLKAKSKYEMIE